MKLLQLKEILHSKGVTGRDLAEKVGVSANSISHIITGQKFPKPDLLVKISKVLDVDIRELFYPTKGFGESPELNGFIEYKNETFKINNYQDLSQLMQKINK